MLLFHLLSCVRHPLFFSQTISSVTPLSPENGGGVCATYRFEGGATKLRVRARTTEGDYGDVRLTVVAKIPPKKSAQVRPFLTRESVLRRGNIYSVSLVRLCVDTVSYTHLTLPTKA